MAAYVDTRLPTPAFINQHIALVRLDPSKTDSRFVAYFLASEKAQRRFRSSTDIGAKAGMSLLTVRKLDLVLPPLVEQRAISSALADADTLLTSLEKLIAKKRDLKQAAMQQLLSGKTRLPGFTGAWEPVSFGSLGKWLSGGTPSMANPVFWAGEIPWVSPKDMKVARLHDAIDHVSNAALGNGTRLAPLGSVLMVVRGMILAHSFPVARAEKAMAFNQDIKALVVREGVESEFVLRWVEANEGLLLSITNESTHGTKRMPMEALFALKCLLPPSDEQRAIARVLSDMEDELNVLDTRLNKTRALKQGMMQELLTGKTRLVLDKDAA